MWVVMLLGSCWLFCLVSAAWGEMSCQDVVPTSLACTVLEGECGQTQLGWDVLGQEQI